MCLPTNAGRGAGAARDPEIRVRHRDGGGPPAGGGGLFRGPSEAEGGPGDLCWGLAAWRACGGREEEARPGSSRAGHPGWGAGCRGGHSPQPPASLLETPLPSSLITTCQSRFPSSLTCLQIFPNKERSRKHGNHPHWQRQTAARAQLGLEPGPPRRGSRRGGGSRSWQSSMPL